jgi:hypothetical protein
VSKSSGAFTGRKLSRRKMMVEWASEVNTQKLNFGSASHRQFSASQVIHQFSTDPASLLTAYLGKIYGRIPYSRTAEFFNRDGASIARDVLALDRSLRDSKELQSRIDNLARGLTRT